MSIRLNFDHCLAASGIDDSFCETVALTEVRRERSLVQQSRLVAGDHLAGYRIERLLGVGAMGEVYLARQLSMDRLVALKVTSANLALDDRARERFNREMRLQALLDHPNVVTAYEAGEANGRQFLAMAYLPGETLEQRLERNGVLSEVEALDLAIRLAETLAYAWNRHGLLHRDVKPANVMVDDKGKVTLMDFGIAQTRAEMAGAGNTGLVMGTPYFMSPEQARGEHLDFRSDLYALAASLFQLITGNYTHTGDGIAEIVLKKTQKAAPRAGSFNPRISAVLEDLLAEFLAISPASRPGSWDEAIDKLKAVRKAVAGSCERSPGKSGRLTPRRRFRIRGSRRPAVSTRLQKPSYKAWAAMVALVGGGMLALGTLLARLDSGLAPGVGATHKKLSVMPIDSGHESLSLESSQEKNLNLAQL